MPRRKKGKKIWTSPVLTVVVRGWPEERALTACKTILSGAGPAYSVGFCQATGADWCLHGCSGNDS